LEIFKTQNSELVGELNNLNFNITELNEENNDLKNELKKYKVTDENVTDLVTVEECENIEILLKNSLCCIENYKVFFFFFNFSFFLFFLLFNV
jgi:hypothetical protein